MARAKPPRVDIVPLNAARWGDLEQLFGARGACGGCWCMAWRLPRGSFERGKGAGNRAALKALAASEPAPGVLAYVGGEPAGWCAIAPRAAYPVLARSRVLKPVDDTPVWSVSCFFVARAHRRRGLSTRLLRAAVAYAASCGARVIEGYPVASRSGALPDVFVWTGLPGTFLAAGFREVARRSPTRPILRRRVRPAQKTQA
jgi:GNAT superfamily N-acetyltransferase